MFHRLSITNPDEALEPVFVAGLKQLCHENPCTRNHTLLLDWTNITSSVSQKTVVLLFRVSIDKNPYLRANHKTLIIDIMGFVLCLDLHVQYPTEANLMAQLVDDALCAEWCSLKKTKRNAATFNSDWADYFVLLAFEAQFAHIRSVGDAHHKADSELLEVTNHTCVGQLLYGGSRKKIVFTKFGKYVDWGLEETLPKQCHHGGHD